MQRAEEVRTQNMFVFLRHTPSGRRIYPTDSDRSGALAWKAIPGGVALLVLKAWEIITK